MSEARKRRHKSSAAGDASKLDQPLAKERRFKVSTGMDPESFGAFAERFARFMGTARFLVWMTIFVVIWMVWNALVPDSWKFDAFPFIFLTLMLSLQASYAAPLILLAQNRQDDRDKVQMEQDRAGNERNLAATEFLTRELMSLRLVMREVATRDYVRSELKSMMEDLDEAAYQRGRADALAEMQAEQHPESASDDSDQRP